MFDIFKKKNKAAEVIEIVNIDGHNFKVLDPVKMPTLRRTRFFTQEYKNDWGLSKEELKAFLQFVINDSKIPTAATIGELNAELLEQNKRLFTIISTLESILNEDYQFKPLLRSASIIILLEDEDPNIVDQKIINEKLRLCQQSSKIEAFFLTTIMTFITSLQSTQDMSKPSDWLKGAKAQKNMESSLYSMINSTIYETGK